VQVICRDRGGAYADGVARGAPDAIQVADRWHLMHNLSEAVQKVVTRHRRCLQQLPVEVQEPAAEPEPVEGSQRPTAPGSTPVPAPAGRRAANTRSRHAAVQELLADGLTIRAIMRRLGMSRGTVRSASTPAPRHPNI
jgi:DNA-binding NarL/FixJ family response regulator